MIDVLELVPFVHHATRRLPAWARADVVQDAIVRMLEARAGFDATRGAVTTWAGWIVRTATHAVLDRAHDKTARASLDEIPSSDGEGETIDTIDRRHQLELVAAALECLSETERAAVLGDGHPMQRKRGIERLRRAISRRVVVDSARCRPSKSALSPP